MNRRIQKKKFHDERCKKLSRKSKIKRKKNNYYNVNENINHNSGRKYTKRVQKDAPRIFSFFDNPIDTIDFFDDIIIDIKRKIFGKTFFINSSQVEEVSVDVLIYLIAIMQNISINMQMQYSFIGNIPKNADAAKIYLESGFMDYVSAKVKKLPKNNDKRRIVYGNSSDPVRASEFCKFVMDKLNVDRVSIQPIQKILIELMSNVYHHAYKKDQDDIMKKKWYLYAECNKDRVKFIFVDTGVGIPKTVRKKFGERIASLFNSDIVSDAELIYSTLSGDFRTETNELYRGNGLPGVYKLAQQEPIMRFELISGRGKCTIVNDGTIKKEEFANAICGTIFVFDVGVKG